MPIYGIPIGFEEWTSVLMSMTRVSGERVTGGASDQTLYTGRGRLLGFLVCHDQASVQTVTFKDEATTILEVHVSPNRSPIMISFGMGASDKLDGIEFRNSLIANAGANSELNVWYLGY